MNEQKFTPGPWNIFQSIGLEIEADGIPICEIWQRGDEEQEQANARLIAAAPDLLEALQSIAREPREQSSEYGAASLRDKARAAIKKATGEE